MNTKQAFAALRDLDLFNGLADEHVQRLAAISRMVEFPPNHDIFRESDIAKDVYVIVTGDVSLYTRTRGIGFRQLTSAGRGELVGWSPLVGRERLSDTARTLTRTTAITFNGQEVLDLCEADPKFGFAFMHRAAKTLAQRLGATRHQLLELGGGQLPEVQIESD